MVARLGRRVPTGQEHGSVSGLEKQREWIFQGGPAGRLPQVLQLQRLGGAARSRDVPACPRKQSGCIAQDG